MLLGLMEILPIWACFALKVESPSLQMAKVIGCPPQNGVQRSSEGVPARFRPVQSWFGQLSASLRHERLRVRFPKKTRAVF